MIAGCLNSDIRLVYRIQFPFDDEIVTLETSDLFVKLPFESEVQGTGLKVNITPVLADLQLVGTPLSLILYEGKFVYVPMTSIEQNAVLHVHLYVHVCLYLYNYMHLHVFVK